MNDYTTRLNRSFAANIKWYIDDIRRDHPAVQPPRAVGLVQDTVVDPMELDRQKHDIKNFAAQRGIVVVRMFVAPGEARSHTTVMEILRAKSESDAFEILLITDPARLGRCADDVFTAIQNCREMDLVIVTVRNGFVLP